MTGARCNQVDGLYVQPGGTSGPSMDMPCGIRIENAITSAPTTVSLRYSAGVGAQNTNGAKTSHAPAKLLAHAAQANLGRSDITASTTTAAPLATSFHDIAALR